MHSRRFRHLLLLAHVWVCLPFALVWLLAPDRIMAANPQVVSTVSRYLGAIAVYLAARTLLAWCDPVWLAWEYVFPILDVALISIGLYLRKDPDSVLTLIYFFAIAEAAGTLNVLWASSVGLLCVLGATLATWGQSPTGLLGGVFRLFFLVVMASLLTWMARLTAELRARLTVAAERHRMALEMHDGIQGQLVTIAAQMELVQRVALQDGTRAAQLAMDSRDLARQAAEELRYMARRMRSSKPTREFLPALQQYLQQMGTRNKLEVKFEVLGQDVTLYPEQEHALFRIAQESLTNVIKHAQASHLNVIINFDTDAIHCSFQDDGVGFDAARLSPDEGAQSGLDNMDGRAKRIGGALSIESRKGAGTTVSAMLPYRFCRENSDATGDDPHSTGGR